VNAFLSFILSFLVFGAFYGTLAVLVSRPRRYR
jgi:hypothetical protein